MTYMHAKTHLHIYMPHISSILSVNTFQCWFARTQAKNTMSLKTLLAEIIFVIKIHKEINTALIQVLLKKGDLKLLFVQPVTQLFGHLKEIHSTI